MTTYRLDALVSIQDLAQFAAALLILARAHTPALSPIPTLAADLQLLEQRTADALARYAEWEAKSRVQGEMYDLRDDAFRDLLKNYAQIRDWLPVLIAKPGGKILKRLLGGCPFPSVLTVAEAPAVLEGLAAGVAAHPERFGSVGVSAADVAALRAHRDALLVASAAYSSADRERGEASYLRDAARDDLVEQLRLIEDYVERRAPDAIVGLKRLRIQHLPRKSRGAAEAEPEPEPAE